MLQFCCIGLLALVVVAVNVQVNCTVSRQRLASAGMIAGSHILCDVAPSSLRYLVTVVQLPPYDSHSLHIAL